MLSGQAWNPLGRADATLTVAIFANCSDGCTFVVRRHASLSRLCAGNGFQGWQAGIVAGNIDNVRFAHFRGHFLQCCVMPPAVAVSVHGFNQVFGGLRRQVGDFGGVAPPVHSMAAGTIGLGNRSAGGNIDRGLCGFGLFGTSRKKR